MVVLLVWFVFTNLILMFGATEDSLSEISPNQLTTAMELLDEMRFPIVYFFTMNENACHRGLPNYMTDSINQAIETQSECCEVYLISSFSLCLKKAGIDLEKNMNFNKHLIRIDFDDDLKSVKTTKFLNTSDQLFAADGLWTSSALRFFAMEDLMRLRGFNAMLHVESDNLLYGPLGNITIPNLVGGYPKLAVTILGQRIATASVMWVADISALSDFNSWMINLASNTSQDLRGYVDWLWPHSCCHPPERGGLFCGAYGHQGCLRPFAVNEMSMLAYYHHLNSTELAYLPLFPAGAYVKNKKHMNVTEYTAGGKLVGPVTGVGVWDSGSYGQYIGGTPRFKGRNKGFIDFFHIIGQGILRAGCSPKFMCGDTFHLDSKNKTRSCRMGPYVRCNGEDGKWTPLWNLHVHCKLTSQFRNIECPCRDREVMPYSAIDEAMEAEKKQLEEKDAARRANDEGIATFTATSGGAKISHVDSQNTSYWTLHKAINTKYDKNTVPIVYFYIISDCKKGIPNYMKDTVAQAVETQSSIVYFISNFNKCKNFGHDIGIGYPQAAVLIDYEELKSNRTNYFLNACMNILGSDGLWASSAIRFFALHDLMVSLGWKNLVHVEGDNLLYHDLSLEAIPAMIANYKSLAATMLSGSFVTASIFWVSSPQSLDRLNAWLVSLTNETGVEFKEFLTWLRPKACCLSQAKGGLYPDEKGEGIRPFAINEMTMLSFYYERFRNDKLLELLPLIPGKEEGLIMKKNNLVAYALGGDMVGGFAGNGVYDPGSYGQYLGGTPAKHGSNKKFVDFAHILGQGMIKSACFPHFLCGPIVSPTNASRNESRRTEIGKGRKLMGMDITNININDVIKGTTPNEVDDKDIDKKLMNSSSLLSSAEYEQQQICRTAPYVRCGVHDEKWGVTYGPWKKIFNLHVHSKHTSQFRSVPCKCGESLYHVHEGASDAHGG